MAIALLITKLVTIALLFIQMKSKGGDGNPTPTFGDWQNRSGISTPSAHYSAQSAPYSAQSAHLPSNNYNNQYDNSTGTGYQEQ